MRAFSTDPYILDASGEVANLASEGVMRALGEVANLASEGVILYVANLASEGVMRALGEVVNLASEGVMRILRVPLIWWRLQLMG